MKNILIMLVVALIAADAGAIVGNGYIGGRVRGYQNGDKAKRLGEGGASEVKEKSAEERNAKAKAKSISESKIVIPEDWICGGSKVDMTGRITSLCGFEIGEVAKLPRHPVLDNEGNIVMTGKLKKPFRKCTQYEVKYSKINHALYSIHVFSPALKMDKESASAELTEMAAAVKTKFDDKVLSWFSSPTTYSANMKTFARQSLSVRAFVSDIDKRNKLKGTADAAPEKGWSFSLELTDHAMHDFDPVSFPANGEVPSGVDAL